MQRPKICEKRGCYLYPKTLYPNWDSLNERCKECPYSDEEDLLRLGDEGPVVEKNKA